MKNFEKYFYNKLKNSRPPVDEQDWLDFQQRLYSQKKKKRGGFWLWSFVSLVGIGAIVLATFLLSDKTHTSPEKLSPNKTFIQNELKLESHSPYQEKRVEVTEGIEKSAVNDGIYNRIIDSRLINHQSVKNLNPVKINKEKILVDAAKDLEKKNILQDNVGDSKMSDEMANNSFKEKEIANTSASEKAKDSLPKIDTSNTILSDIKNIYTKKKKLPKESPMKLIAGVETGLYHWSGDSSKANAAYIQPVLMAQTSIKNFMFSAGLGYAVASVKYSHQVNIVINDSFPIYDTTGKILAWVKTGFRDTLVTATVKGGGQSIVIPIEIGYKFKINSKFSISTNVGVTAYIKSGSHLKYTDPISQQPVYPKTTNMAMIGQLSLSARYSLTKHWGFQLSPVYFYVISPESKMTGSTFKFQALYTF